MKKLTEMNRNDLLSEATKLQRALDIRENLGKEHDRILKELKAERVRNRELAAKCDSLLVNSKGKYQPEMEELERFINEELEAEYCSQTSHAMSDAKNIIRRQQNELSSFASKIADLETANASLTSNNKQRFAENAKLVEQINELKAELALAVKERCPHDYELFRSQNAELNGTVNTLRDRIADLETQLAAVSKSETSGKVDGVFAVGDRVEIHGCKINEHLNGTVATITCVMPTSSHYDMKGDAGTFSLYGNHLRHAAQTCESCTAKQKRIEELEKKHEVERDRANDLLADRDHNAKEYSKNIKTLNDVYLEHEEQISKYKTTIESYAADMEVLQNHIALDKSSILRLTRELSAALLGGG